LFILSSAIWLEKISKECLKAGPQTDPGFRVDRDGETPAGGRCARCFGLMNICIRYNWNRRDRCSATSNSVQANKSEPVVSETSKTTTLALLNLIRLLAAELVAGAHRDDVAKLILAIDRQLDATPIPAGVDASDARAGISQARELLRPHIARVRELAEAALARDQAAAPIGGEAGPASRSSKYLH
jgi:hypothetical protein